MTTVSELIASAVNREPGEFGAVFGELMRDRLVEAVSSRKRAIAEGLFGSAVEEASEEVALDIGDLVGIEEDEREWEVVGFGEDTVILENEDGEQVEELLSEVKGSLGDSMKKYKRMYKSSWDSGDPRDLKKRLKGETPERKKELAGRTGKLGGAAELQRRLAKKMTKESVEPTTESVGSEKRDRLRAKAGREGTVDVGMKLAARAKKHNSFAKPYTPPDTPMSRAAKFAKNKDKK